MPNSPAVPGSPGTVLQVSPLLPALENALTERYRTVRLPELTDPAAYLRDHGRASATRETRAAMADLALRNVRRFMTEGVLLTPVPDRPAR